MGLEIYLPLIPWPEPSAGSDCTLSASCVFSFFWDRGVEFFSDQIFSSRHEIFYAGIGLSAVAILAALSAKIGWVVLFTAGAALCFALAAWAFQTREVKLSQDLRLVNGRFLQSVQTGEANVAKEREHCEHLQKNVAELEEISQEQACEIMTLRQVAEQQELELAQFSLKVKALQAQNQRLLDIEERIRSWV